MSAPDPLFNKPTGVLLATVKGSALHWRDTACLCLARMSCKRLCRRLNTEYKAYSPELFRKHRRQRSIFGDADGRRQYPDGDGRFDKAPILNFNDDRLKFNTNDCDNYNDNYGSASGFLPKSLSSSKTMPASSAGIVEKWIIGRLLWILSIRRAFCLSHQCVPEGGYIFWYQSP